MHKPLEDIKVVELSTYIAAPSTAEMLCNMGAEVIKVENFSGDAQRVEDTRFPDYDRGFKPFFDVYNAGKKSICIDIKNKAGRAVLMKLIEQADVFLTNLRIPALKRLGLDHDALKDRYPRLIYAIGLGYGEKGPDANAPAFDHTAFWARCGFLLDMAPITEDYHPVYPPSSVGDNFTGMTLAAEVCAALFNRAKTGRGDYVRSSLFHNGVFAMGAMQIATQQPGGSVYPRPRQKLGVASGDYKCKDGRYVYIEACHGRELQRKLCREADPEGVCHHRQRGYDRRPAVQHRRRETAEFRGAL